MSMQSNPVWEEPWKLRTPPISITDRLHYVGNRDVSSHLIDTGDGLVLIDTAFAQTAYLLTESIRAAGADPADIKIILHCHAYVDHCGATRRLKELTGATTAMGEADVETVEKGTPRTCAEYWYGMAGFETFPVDRPLKHMDTVELGEVTITCHHTPGHTAGTMTYAFEMPVDGTRRLVGLFGGPGLWSMRDEHRETQGYPGNREDFAKTLAYLKTLDVELWLGAHAEQCDTFAKAERLAKSEIRLANGEKPNPFIDPAGWKRFIGGLEAEFNTMIQE